MRNFACLFLTFALVIMIAGCSQQSNPVDNQNVSTPLVAGKVVIPSNATLESATLHIYTASQYEKEVNVHRITADWGETTVTWANFGGAYAPGVFTTFTTAIVNWNEVDVTTLVQGWLDGTYENYGLLLDQVEETYPWSVYYSRENTVLPLYLEVCYSVDGVTSCEETFAIADTYIWESNTTTNFGTRIVLYTGWQSETTLEKQTLIRFELESTPVEEASIGDYVWLDDNRNGIQDEGEVGKAGVTVNLYDCQDVLLATTVTDENGYYLFSGLMPGDYYVEFVLPFGYVFSPQDQGMDDAIDSDADPITGKAICTTLEADEHDMTWDAGLYMPVIEGCSNTIGYWKNWTGLKKQPDMVTPLLPIWLGNADGDESIEVTDVYISTDILKMKTYCDDSNGITKLYAQLLGTKLSIANGASGDVVADYITLADDFLAEHDCYYWYEMEEEDQQVILDWKDMFDNFNNGDIGPGHCE